MNIFFQFVLCVFDLKQYNSYKSLIALNIKNSFTITDLYKTFKIR